MPYLPANRQTKHFPAHLPADTLGSKSPASRESELELQKMQFQILASAHGSPCAQFSFFHHQGSNDLPLRVCASIYTELGFLLGKLSYVYFLRWWFSFFRCGVVWCGLWCGGLWFLVWCQSSSNATRRMIMPSSTMYA